MNRARFAILLSVATPLFFSTCGLARTITVIVTGKVATGTDSSGVFGAANADLAGKPFRLAFTFDDAKGQNTFPPCGALPVCYSQVIGAGSALLQIGDTPPYSFSGAVTDNVKSQLRKQIWPNTYQFMVAVGDDSAGVTMDVSNQVSRPPAAANPDWRHPFLDKTLSKTPAVMSGVAQIRFKIANRSSGATASGILTPATLCVGDASTGCSYTPPAAAIAAKPQQDSPTAGATSAAMPSSSNTAVASAKPRVCLKPDEQPYFTRRYTFRIVAMDGEVRAGRTLRQFGTVFLNDVGRIAFTGGNGQWSSGIRGRSADCGSRQPGLRPRSPRHQSGRPFAQQR